MMMRRGGLQAALKKEEETLDINDDCKEFGSPLTEINEFYSYAENEEILQGAQAFQDAYPAWSSLNVHEKKTLVSNLLGSLEDSESGKRHTSLRSLHYISLGSFSECNKSEINLFNSMISNNVILFQCGGLNVFIKHFLGVCASSSRSKTTASLQTSYELRVSAGLIYQLVEIGRYLKGEENAESRRIAHEIQQEFIVPVAQRFFCKVLLDLLSDCAHGSNSHLPTKKYRCFYGK
eukprot:m.278970 g.278970  ORF g.278970 m.278970 type:complete len:235 (+) comp16320_c0_seq11:60-764(+)